MQFEAAVTSNVERLTGSPVWFEYVSVTPGSVVVVSKVLFLDGSKSSASAYQSALVNGDVAAVYGDSFSTVVVDISSVQAVEASNPSKLSCH